VLATNTCELPGSGGDAPPMPDACASATCEGDVLVGCGQTVTCANGCTTDPAAHCRRLAPSNGLTAGMLEGATADINLDKLNFDTDDGSIKRMNVVIRNPGEGVIDGIRFQEVDGVAVWVANSWTLPANESWSFSSGEEPVTLFANTTIEIAGTIDVGGSGSVGGPGGTGSYGSTAASPGGCQGRAGRLINTTHAEGGGGGGGQGIAGGNGGPSNQGATNGIGGNCADRPSTIPLRGGNGGGEGGNSTSNDGGGGGGAISLVAMEMITISGTVAAPGAGGGILNGNGGGGGGSGGAILLEAPVVSIPGNLTANGGGGAAASGSSPGARGSSSSATPASGGSYTAPNGDTGRGGAGGTSMAAATNGDNYTYSVTDPTTMVTTNYNRGAGGGGAVGRIEVKRVTGGVSGLASPAAVVTDAVVE
jgi:hypothetical protein